MLIMDILQLHDAIVASANIEDVKIEKLSFDFNNDYPYCWFAQDAINSKLFPAFNNFKVINSHGEKSIKDHKKQINYWNEIGNQPIFTLNELNTILDYHNLP